MRYLAAVATEVAVVDRSGGLGSGASYKLLRMLSLRTQR